MKGNLKKILSYITSMVMVISCVSYASIIVNAESEFSFDTLTSTIEYNEDNTEGTIKFDLSDMPTTFNVLQFTDENSLDLDKATDTNVYSTVVTENKTFKFNIVYTDGSKDDQEQLIEKTVTKEVTVDGIEASKKVEPENNRENEPSYASTDGVTLGLASTKATEIDLSTVEGDIFISTDGLYTQGVAKRTTASPLYTYSSGTKIEDFNANGYTFTGTATNKTILVDPITKPQVTITLSDINMSQEKSFKSAIVTSNTKTEIVLLGDNDIQSAALFTMCIEKNGSEGQLTISGTGTINVEALAYHAGCIGSVGGDGAGSGMNGPLYNFENLYITGGTINAKGGSSHNPGIGAGCAGTGYGGKYTKNINITGGIVNATGGDCCSGIGSGAGVPVDGINISGGAIVIARGGNYSPGIGSGGTTNAFNGAYNFATSNISITGGDTIVTAYGDARTNMPGIGCGKDYANRNASSRVVSNVTAYPETNYQGYVKYGTSDTDYAFSTANPTTPFPTSEEFGHFLQSESNNGDNVYYTQVYFGPYKDNNDLDKDANIGSNDTVAKTGGSPFTTDQLIDLTKPDGNDENGDPIDFLSYTLDADEVKKINDAKAASEVGDFPLTYTYTYTDTTGDSHTLTVVSTVSLRDEGDPENNTVPALGGNGAIHKTGGAAFTEEEIVKLTDTRASNAQGMNAILKHEDGSLVIPDSFTVDPTTFNALNAAKVAGETGTYNVKYTYTDGEKTLTITVPVTLFDNGSTTVEGPEIGGGNVYQEADGNEFTVEQIRDASGVAARDSNGNIVDKTDLIPNDDQLKAINESRKAKKDGVFDLDYTFVDVDGNNVTVSTKVYLYLGQPPLVVANDKTISSTDASKVTSVEDLDKYTNPKAVINNDGTTADITGREIDPDDLAAIEAGTPGEYDVTYKYTYTDLEGGSQTVEKTVTITVVDNAETTAENKTVSSTTAKGYTNKKDLITIMGNEITLDDGSKVTPTEDTNVTVSDADWAKIQAGKEGTYHITFTYTDEYGTPLSITKDLIVTDATTITATSTTVSSTTAMTYDDTTDFATIMGAVVTLDDGTTTVPDTTTISEDDMESITNGVPGDYKVTFTYTDPDTGKKVVVTRILTITDKTVIEAQDKTISKEESKDITEKEDLIDLMDAVVTLDDGTKVIPTGVQVDNFDSIKNGVPGVYQVTFTYVTQDGRTLSVTKTLTITDIKINVNDKKTKNIITGDNSNIQLYAILSLLSVAIVSLVVIKRKKEVE